MAELIVTLIARLLLIILIITDIRMNYKRKKSDPTLHRELTKKQKIEQVLYIIVLVVGLAVPIAWKYLVFTLLAFVYFFYFTDREIYVNKNNMFFRAQYYELKHVRNIRFEKHVLYFDYYQENIKLAHPLLSEAMIDKEIIQRVQRLEEKNRRQSSRRK